MPKATALLKHKRKVLFTAEVDTDDPFTPVFKFIADKLNPLMARDGKSDIEQEMCKWLASKNSGDRSYHYGYYHDYYYYYQNYRA